MSKWTRILLGVAAVILGLFIVGAAIEGWLSGIDVVIGAVWGGVMVALFWGE